MIKGYPDFENLQMKDETVLLLPDLIIYPERRKVFCIQEEISLTVKEYDILCLLVINQGRVLTYDWIYEKIWGEAAIGNINNAIACHIHNLREKIYKVLSEPQFSIRCVREIGYCLELKPEQKKIS